MQKLVVVLRGVFKLVVEQCDFHNMCLNVVSKKTDVLLLKIHSCKPGRNERPVSSQTIVCALCAQKLLDKQFFK